MLRSFSGLVSATDQGQNRIYSRLGSKMAIVYACLRLISLCIHDSHDLQFNFSAWIPAKTTSWFCYLNENSGRPKLHKTD